MFSVREPEGHAKTKKMVALAVALVVVVGVVGVASNWRQTARPNPLMAVEASQDLYVAPHTYPDTLPLGLTINEGQFLASVHNNYIALVQTDGNFVVYHVNGGRITHPVWASHTHGRGVRPFRLLMQSDQNCVLYDGKNVPTWATNTQNHGVKNRLVMQSDGNLVLYTTHNHPVWHRFLAEEGQEDANKKVEVDPEMMAEAQRILDNFGKAQELERLDKTEMETDEEN